jgi:hypothetical protein
MKNKTDLNIIEWILIGFTIIGIFSVGIFLFNTTFSIIEYFNYINKSIIEIKYDLYSSGHTFNETTEFIDCTEYR